MKSKRSGGLILFSLLFLVFIPQIDAATIHGSVYDIFLEELDKAVITIDTEPQQTAVSKNGEYSFEVIPGKYDINAIYYGVDDNYETNQEINVKEDGVFNIDLILTPILDPEIDDINIDEFEDLSEDFTIEEENGFSWGLLIAFLAMVTIVLYFHFSKHHFIKEVDEFELKSENEEELEKIIKFIKSNGGRATQKEIRKNFPSVKLRYL